MIVVTNTIQIRKGHGESIAERFQNPKGVHHMPGFISMELWLTQNLEECDEIKVNTTWESREAFDGWVKSDSFKQSHGDRKKAQAERSGNTADGSEEGPIILGNKISIHTVLFTVDAEPVKA
ncbi:antibiotic biosynthesis monooxygenase [Paenibacillus terrigena]|uniref:antibiotic biosynthesis monooxygenase n=1 Tax=Paenibacillus terrigena TaxID=369333 RepID=UPI0003760847|nr:antibiotic biosynthesis monooxygenase [Paenibacillus terrigena]